MRCDGVGIEVVEKSSNDGVGFWDVHFLIVKLGHFGGVEAFEMRPSRLKDHFVDVDGRRGGCVG